MKKYLLILSALLLAAASYGIFGGGGRREPRPQQERREVREKRRAERLAKYEKFMDSVVLSRNFQFNPQTMQQMPAGAMRIINNPNYLVGYWEGTVDICLPYIKGYVPPYRLSLINYTVPGVEGYTTEQTDEGWTVSFNTSLFSASTYTFTLEISGKMGGATLTVTNPWYNAVQYTGTITPLY